LEKISVFFASGEEFIERPLGGSNGCGRGHIDDASDKLLRRRRRHEVDMMPSQVPFQEAP
jgi:hypothetical protein